MIESAKFKKMLNILKTNTKDLNTDISIVDYDTAKECDYEVLTLHLKETNTQNEAVVYKKFIIRSQLYYDENDNKYYSALDGNVIAQNKAFAKINILTTITEETFATDNVSIRVQLIDEDTQQPLKNQSLFMKLGGYSDQLIASASTDKNGEAIFKFSLSNLNIFSGEHLIYIEYKGNNIYQNCKSDYIAINFSDVQKRNIDTNIEAYIDPTEDFIVRLNMSIDNKNFVNAYNDNTEIKVDESSLLSGRVLFFIGNTLLGTSELNNSGNNITYGAIVKSFPKQYYNQDVDIQAVFEGNAFFDSCITSMPIRYNRITPTNIALEVIPTDDGFGTRLSFDVDSSLPINDNLYQQGFDDLYRLHGEILFYLENANHEWGTIVDNLPFYIANTFQLEQKNNNTYTISTETDALLVNRNNYSLDIDSPLYVKAIYSGNAIIDSFEVDNKPR